MEHVAKGLDEMQIIVRGNLMKMGKDGNRPDCVCRISVNNLQEPGCERDLETDTWPNISPENHIKRIKTAYNYILVNINIALK